MDGVTNFAYGTVLTAPSPATSGTSLVLNSGQGANFPDPATSGPFNVVVWPSGQQPLSTNAEIVRCTARTTDTLTITRTQEGSGNRSILVGDQAALNVTALTVTDLRKFRGCRVKRNSNQLINNTTLTKISFDAVRYGDTSMFNFAGNPTRITIPETGYWTVGGYVEFDLNATGGRYGDIFVNNTTRVCELSGGVACTAGDNPQCVGSAVAFFTAGDFIELRVYQNRGGTLNVIVEADIGPDMWAVWEGT